MYNLKKRDWRIDMDEKWAAYEEKQKELKKHFKAQYIKVIAIFLLYNGVADTLLILFAEAMNWPVAIVAFLVSTGISFYIMLKTVAELRRIKHQQYLKLQQDAPVGKIRI